MFAIKTANGRVRLLSVIPDGTDSYFEFDPKDLPKVPDGDKTYNLIVDFKNKSFSLVEDAESNPEPTAEEKLRADVDFLLAMGGYVE